MRTAVIITALTLTLATGAGASALASYILTAEVVDAGEHDAGNSTMMVTLNILQVTEDRAGYGMDFFTYRIPETIISVELLGVSRPLKEGALIEVVFNHVSGIVPGSDGNIEDYQIETWELLAIL
jgi:hypothetical protein